MAISSRLTLVLVVVFCATNVLADIAFPEAEEEADSKKNSEHKMPLFLPNQCNENELFYPGDYKDDWVCDCKHGYIYYPKTDRCYRPYLKGPCSSNQYLMIPSGEYIPECLLSRCSEDGLVYFRNQCHSLDQVGPCRLAAATFVVAVNETTLELDCIQQNPEIATPSPDLSNRFNDYDADTDTTTTTTTQAPVEEPMFGTSCLPGTKRSIRGLCEK